MTQREIASHAVINLHM